MTDSSKNLIFRIALDLTLFLGVFMFPFWLTAIIALIGLIYFRNFYEFIIAFVLIDLLYATELNRYGGSVFILTIVSVAIFFLASLAKKKILRSS